MTHPGQYAEGKPTPEEANSDVAWARHQVEMWLCNSHFVYDTARRLADLSPQALGIFVVGVLYGDAERDFGHDEVGVARDQVRCSRVAAQALEVALVVEAGCFRAMPDESDRGAAEYTADTLARRDVRRIDWEQLARDVWGEGEPSWARQGEDGEVHDNDTCPRCSTGQRCGDAEAEHAVWGRCTGWKPCTPQRCHYGQPAHCEQQGVTG